MSIEKQYKQVNGVKIELNEEELAQRELDRLEWERISKPIAKGKDLVSDIEKAFKGQPFVNRMQLQSLFSAIKLTLESETCNPLNEDDFDFVLNLINQNTQLTAEQKKLFISLGNKWKESVRFI